MLINTHMLKTYWKKNYFPVFQWELNHTDTLIKTASSSWEPAEPMERMKERGTEKGPNNFTTLPVTKLH